MTTNGTGPTTDDYTATIDQTIINLREAADAASRVAAVKRNEYEAAADQAKRLQRALAALEPPAPTPKKTGAKWQISDERVADVLAVIKRMGADEFTASDVLKAADGMASETVRQATDVLREREVLRLVRTGRGGSKVLALMPDQ